uniref:Uncharacterized protein n=1 Tax=Arundo donax TaxID=35708 RepID=A0A0A9GJ82_ARUDO
MRAISSSQASSGVLGIFAVG